VLVAFILALAISIVNGLPRPHLTSKPAEPYANEQLRVYCHEHNLKVKLFGKPRIARGAIAYAELKPDGSVYDRYAPTWDYHYTYKGTPLVTVVVSYDTEAGVAEVADVIGD
jgi:hypothetical protein